MGEMSGKEQKTKLNWYGLALSREREYVGKIVIGMDVEGRVGKQEMDGLDEC